MFKTVFIFSLLALCIHVSTTAQSQHEELSYKLDSILDQSSIVGMGAAIFTKDSLLFSEGYGVIAKDNGVKYTPTTRQKIASISKLLLGVSIMKADEIGLLDLDDDVNDYLPFSLTNPYHPQSIITIRHLASHTAGLAQLPDYDQKALYFPTKIPRIKDEMPWGIKRWFFNRIVRQINANKKLPLEEFLAKLYTTDGEWYSKKHFLDAVPGSESVYSNTGASLLALIIEKASCMTYEDFVKEYILDPAGMSNSSFDFDRSTDTQENAAEYYHSGIHIPNDYELLLYPAGGFESSVMDFYRFMSVISGDLHGHKTLLSKAATIEMLTPQFGTEHGILWEVYENGEIGHRGDIIGATTFTYYNVKKDKGYILFLNTGGTDTLDDETHELRALLERYFD